MMIPDLLNKFGYFLLLKKKNSGRQFQKTSFENCLDLFLVSFVDFKRLIQFKSFKTFDVFYFFLDQFSQIKFSWEIFQFF